MNINMKITKTKLKQLIKEETEKLIMELQTRGGIQDIANAQLRSITQQPIVTGDAGLVPLIDQHMADLSDPAAGAAYVDDAADLLIGILDINTPEEAEEFFMYRTPIAATMQKKVNSMADMIPVAPEEAFTTPEEEAEV